MRKLLPSSPAIAPRHSFKTSLNGSLKKSPEPTTPIFFCLPNQSTSETFQAVPWEFKPAPPKSALKDREHWREWAQRPTTKHLFFTSFEGTNPHLRIAENNPPIYMHGLIADYDADISDAMMRDVSFAESSHWSAVSKTFSGGRRAVWLFERPLLLHSVQLTKKFIERAVKELRLKNLLPGLDEQAILHPAKYYECGTDWQVSKLGHDLIPSAAVNLWLMEASQKYDWAKEGVAVPLELVAAEVEKKFPGRWDGPFELGGRGRRFWDPEANNPTAAIIRETGMQCFTGPKSFTPWAEIIGAKFVAKFEEDRLGGAVEDIWFDGKDYWMKGPSGQYMLHNQQNLSRHLRVKRGLSGDRGKKENHSEVDQALVMVEDHQRIEAALPFVHQPFGLVWRNHRRFLNTSAVQVIQPVNGTRKWAEGFPWLADFLDNFLVSREALDCLLAWLQRFYASALDRQLAAGQAVFFAGGVGQGKSLFSTVIMSELMGGSVDASSYLLGETNFNKPLFEVCLWCIDDSIPGSDPRKHTYYSAAIKKMVANRVFEYHAKFKDASSVPWVGRVAVTLNDDEESMRILPDMEMNTLDKISLFKIKDLKNRKFPKQPTKTIQEELPHFARWLLDWTAPKHTAGKDRFGVRSFHDPSMLQQAKESSDSAHFYELLEYFRRTYFSLNEDRTHWKGTATELYAWMTSEADQGMRELARTYNTRSMGRNLMKLMAQGAPLRQQRTGGGGGRQWVILKADGGRPKPKKQALPKEEDNIDDL